MATLRFVSTQYTFCSPVDWIQLAFATKQCSLARNEQLGTIKNLVQCKILQEMNASGVPYRVVDHINSSYDILVPYDNPESFTPLKQCQQCIYNKTK
ncbi:MAG: hypothetical protein IKS08_00960 [Alphaproteobacteria bacterium]|nr:hypothetical protein [Alphaproteobacteria bacterium]